MHFWTPAFFFFFLYTAKYIQTLLMTGSSLQKIKGICKKLSNTDLSRSPPGKSSRYHVNYVLSKITSKLSCTLVSLRRLTTLWLKKKKKLGFFSVYIKIAQTSRYYTPTPHCSQASWQSPLRWPMSQLTGAVSRDISGVGAIETVSWDVRAFLPSARSTHQPEKKTKHFHLSSLPQCPRTLPLLILHQV